MSSEPSSSKENASPPVSPRQISHAHATSVSHIPAHPSKLREATNMSPEDGRNIKIDLPQAEDDLRPDFPPTPPALHVEASSPTADTYNGPIHNQKPYAQAFMAEPQEMDMDERTRLLRSYHDPRVCGLKHCEHGTFTPRALSVTSTDGGGSVMNGYFGRVFKYNASQENGHANGGLTTPGIFETFKKTSSGAARYLGFDGKPHKWMYLQYYFPFLKWITQYQVSWFRGDLVAALTMASFYIPMSLSYASNLGHIPPVNGLYSFVFNPVIYALLGTCPQMVVGPEAAGSLLVGQVVRECISQGNSSDQDDILNAQIAGIVTSVAGAVILAAGIARLGFLDSVLSRPFLRGFISAIGFVILVDQTIPELGLKAHAVSHGSSWEKLVYICQHAGHAHKLTAIVSISSFVIIMVFRTLKKSLQPRYPAVAYFPDRFLVVVVASLLAWGLDWKSQGLELLGNVKASGGYGIPFHWPLKTDRVKHIDVALGTSVLISLLGFFESSVAAKSLGEGTTGLRGMTPSSNRELIALGTANVVGGCFMSLPAFGGYGRSKVNASTGGTTPMSSIMLSIISLLCVAFMLPYFYWIPKGVLSAMISVVAYSLIEEAPHDIQFFVKIKGYKELALMAIIFLSTIFYSLSVGIALGISLSLLAVIKHAAKPRIQILGRVPGQPSMFENVESSPDSIEHVEGCLIVKIPEPLTFANTGDLRTRLKRLEHYGDNMTHPSRPRVRCEENNRNLIFDVHGVTSIDGSGTQVLAEIVKSYRDCGTRVLFCRLPKRKSKVYQRFEDSGIIESCGGPQHFVASVDEALRLSEIEDLQQYFEDRADGSGHMD